MDLITVMKGAAVSEFPVVAFPAMVISALAFVVVMMRKRE
jgi:hypothetical protein